ncbi:dual specificity protein kinase Ttk-like [Uloborus diversus]|uniref:dual specificity protein kinase Ttk-like n=1 Tax=Uloborus diversus TaxID=327109 RepID=UPI00240A3F86|nr:dual specificity protein kinase Ttk-like [Uloborus diversus]
MDKRLDLSKRNYSSSHPTANLSHTSSQLLHETHPSVSSKNRSCLDDIFKKINSDPLSRLPTYFDPNTRFSDDDDDEEDEVGNDQRIVKEEGKQHLEVENIEPNISGKCAKSVSTSFDGKGGKPLLTDFHAGDKRHIDHQKHNSGFFSSSNLTSFRKNVSHAQNLFPHSEKKMPSFQKNSAFQNVKTNLDLQLKSTLNQQEPKNSEKPNLDAQVKSTLNQQVSEDQEKNPHKSSALRNEVIEVNGKGYSKLSLLGSGGSCKVYSVFDIETKSRYAIKWVKLKDIDPSILNGYKQEIQYLEKLKDSKRVIKMYDYEYRENDLLIVLEHGDIDFAKYLSNETKSERLTPLKIKFYWNQMLEAVSDIHKHGIVHSDLKPANFLFVAGNLKLIDFGIAALVPDDKTSTFRNDQVGTLNYMSPEAITQMSFTNKEKPVFKIGVKSDVWSLGCILYNLVYGFTPFYHIKTLFQKIHAITDPNFEITFKPLSDNLLLDVLKQCLKRNPKERASVETLLKHPYLRDERAEASASSSKPDDDLKTIFEKMQILTPRRMKYVTEIVRDLSEKSNT